MPRKKQVPPFLWWREHYLYERSEPGWSLSHRPIKASRPRKARAPPTVTSGWPRWSSSLCAERILSLRKCFSVNQKQITWWKGIIVIMPQLYCIKTTEQAYNWVKLIWVGFFSSCFARQNQNFKCQTVSLENCSLSTLLRGCFVFGWCGQY